jgi:hypothetical protein
VSASTTTAAGCDVCNGDLSIYCPRCSVTTPMDDLRTRLASHLSKHFPGVLSAPGGLKAHTDLLVPTTSKALASAKPGNLFVTALWNEAKPHLASYLIRHRVGENGFLRYNVLTDTKLIDMKFAEDKDAPEPFSDRIVVDPILIILLGVQCTSNRELPGIILETIRLRDFKTKRKTILVNEPTSPWRASHKAFSPELDSEIGQKFTKIVIPRKAA